MYKKLSVKVYGEVHGVGFRRFILRKAEDLGLSGWVRNRNDDTVEIEAVGAITPLEDFFAQIKSGPENAIVAQVDDQWLDFIGEPGGEFEIRDTK